MSNLAKKCDTNTTYLSKYIHDNYDTNFSSLINELRIREAQELMSNPEFQNYSIEGIGLQVGFKSKSAFNTALGIYGLTPSYYIQYIREKSTNLNGK